MNPAVSVQIAHADPNAAPLTLNEEIDILNPLITATLTGATFLYYLKQQGTPGTDDQDKAWIELDSGGRPLSIKIFYNGNWRRVYNGMVGEIRMFSGDPTNATNWTQPWNNATTGGKGVIGGIFDGWQICNGNNGSPDLRDKFMVCGSSYTSPNWQSTVDDPNVAPKTTGGSHNHMISDAELPPINPNDPAGPRDDLTIHGFAAKTDPTETHTIPQVIVDTNYAALHPFDSTIGYYGADPSGGVPQSAILTVPPWIAQGFIVFIGY